MSLDSLTSLDLAMTNVALCAGCAAYIAPDADGIGQQESCESERHCLDCCDCDDEAELELDDDTCGECAGTGIGRFGDPDTATCAGCNGSGSNRRHEHDD
jgi:hypothetical protein